MQIDDRLATVLRTRASGEAAARTQYRQLLDLLGTARPDAEMMSEAEVRLAELAAMLPAEEQSRILREPGLRLRNPALVEFLATREAKPAAAAMATARLTEDEWLELIPNLPIQARGFLRHRRDLPLSTTVLLKRLGVQDLVLTRDTIEIDAVPEVPQAGVPQAGVDAPLSVNPSEPDEKSKQPQEGIGLLLRRIEAFRENRRGAPEGTDRPPSPANDPVPVEAVDFMVAPTCRIDSADGEFAPMLVGMMLGTGEDALARLEREHLLAIRSHQPLHAVPFALDRPAPLGGEWRLDAVPLFAMDGRYTGHACRIRRPMRLDAATIGESDAGERIRQLLHELRTPVNAIQGFAEIIQQQLFAPVPNDYRALAAGIAVDAARLLAGFDEVDRLAKLESGAMELEPGEADMRAAVVQTIRRLENATSAREAGFDLSTSGSPFTVGIDQTEALGLVWRILASLAGALALGEKVEAVLHGDGVDVTLDLELPDSLAASDDVFAASTSRGRDASAMRAGTFGTDFALRLARAEARAAGGSLLCTDGRLTLALPCSTVAGVASSRP